MVPQGSALDAYPRAYHQHTVPLIFLSGLPSEEPQLEAQAPTVDHGLAVPTPFRVTSEAPRLTSDPAAQVRDAFLEAAVDASASDRRSQKGQSGSVGVHIIPIGRVSI